MLLPHINHNGGVKNDHFFLKKTASLFRKGFSCTAVIQDFIEFDSHIPDPRNP